MSEKTKNLFKWEGLKKELPWILFFIVFIFLIWGYKVDKNELDKVRDTQCYQICVWETAIENLTRQNPDYHFQCDFETKECLVSGWRDDFGNRTIKMDMLTRSLKADYTK